MLSTLVTSAILVTACAAPAAAPAPTSAPAATSAPVATTAPTTAPAATNTAEPTVAPTAVVTAAATTAPAAVTIPDSAKVMVATSSLGKILVDDKGMTLYMFTKDTPRTSTCYDKCATAWPPLLTKNMATAGDGADASLLGTTTRKDGSMQVTYNKMPLYYYAKDKAPGDTVGQDVGQVWYVVDPTGKVIK
jgi:predicted lipoprotein with Yx(FWY)xxD motif